MPRTPHRLPVPPQQEPCPSEQRDSVAHPTSPLTGDAEAVLGAGLLQGEEPGEEPADGQEGQEGTGGGLGHPADGRVGSAVAAHDVSVQVDVLEADGCSSHRQAPAHLPVEAMHGPWAARRAPLAAATQAGGTRPPPPPPAAQTAYLRAGIAARCRSRWPDSGSRCRWRSRCRRRAGSSARGAGHTSPGWPRCR